MADLKKAFETRHHHQMKSFKFIIPAWLLLAVSSWAGVSFDKKVPQLAFAAEEIEKALQENPGIDFDVALRIAADPSAPQAYEIRTTAKNKAEVIGADAVGAMYGGLEIAEKIRIRQPFINSKSKPHIAQRGIKFNLPLDLRTPTYSDPSDAAQANIPIMWTMEFWKETFDDMARHRYNV
ncbi:MAG: hypothetical protein ACRDBP_13825, partial [Luteolibacter sp.]